MYKQLLSKTLKNRQRSYKEYLADKGINNEGALKDTLSELREDNIRASSDSARLQSLDESGLSHTGYAQHIRAMGEDTERKRTEGAYGDYMRANLRAERDYASYTDRYDKLQSEEQEKLIEYLKENRIFTESGAYDIVKDSALTPENAYDVITRGVKLARQKAIDEAVGISVARMYSFYASRRYALAVGLSAEDAYEVAKKALQYHEDDAELKNIYDDNYLEYLKKRLETYRQYGHDNSEGEE